MRPYSVVILRHSMTSLRQPEIYLTNRKWQVRSTMDLKEMLNFVLSSPPDLVLISCQHPSPKIKTLPKILAQAFSCHVLPYADEPAPAMMRTLNEINAEFGIFPPVSGPAIERTIAKVLKRISELTGGKAKPKMTDSGLYIPPAPDDLIAIRGQQEAKEAINKMLQSELSSSTTPVMQKGVDGRTEAMVDKGQAQAIPQATQQGLKGTVEHKNLQEPQKSKSDHFSWDKPTENSDQDLKSDKNKTTPLKSEDKKSNPASAGPKGFEIDDSNFSRDKKISTPQNKKHNPFLGSALEDGVSAAIEKSVVKSIKPNPELVADTENLACILVKSKKISGYLLAALGKNKKVDFPFLGRVQKHLKESLLSLGEILENEIAFDFKLEPLNFQNWMDADADFLKTSQHKGDQLKMAFFPRKDIEPPIQKSLNEKMFQLPLSEFAPDTKVLFDSFIHLPLNNKYLLYIPKDKTFYSEQKNRLIEKKVEFMHVPKIDMSNLKKYRAQIFLEEKYRAHKKEKAAVTATTA